MLFLTLNPLRFFFPTQKLSPHEAPATCVFQGSWELSGCEGCELANGLNGALDQSTSQSSRLSLRSLPEWTFPPSAPLTILTNGAGAKVEARRRFGCCEEDVRKRGKVKGDWQG